MKKNFKEIVKGTSKFVASASVGIVIRNVLKTSMVVVPGGALNTVGFLLGTMLISNSISDKIAGDLEIKVEKFFNKFEKTEKEV